MRRRRIPRSIELARRIAAARDPQERARLEDELAAEMMAERIARHGPPDPDGEISRVKGRDPIMVQVLGHVFPDGTAIDYGGPVDDPRCMLPSADADPPANPLQAPWVFRLPVKDEDR